MDSASDKSTSNFPGAYLVFTLSGRYYGIKSDFLVESVRLPELTQVDDEPNYIAGVINLRGRVVPVMDLHMRMGSLASRYNISDTVIILKNDKRSLGIIACELEKLTTFSAEDIGSLEHFEHSQNDSHYSYRLSNCVSGVAKDGENLVMILDLEALFASGWSMEKAQDSDQPEVENARREIASYFCPEAEKFEREIFRKRKLRLMQPHEGLERSGKITLAIVVMGGENLALELENVNRFAKVSHITPIPCCPGHILGDINLRGEIITVLDLREVIGLSKPDVSPPYSVVVVTVDGIRAGVAVENIVDVVRMDKSRIGTIPVAGSALSQRLIKGAVIFEKNVYSIIDIRKMILDENLSVNDMA